MLGALRPGVVVAGQPGRTARLLGVAVAVIVLLLPGASTGAVPSPGDGTGRVHREQFDATYGSASYLVYTPRSYRPSLSWPLYVMLHGCGTSPAQQMHANELNQLADSAHFVVLYPDTPVVGAQCWRAIDGDPSSIHRGGHGDADIIAGMTLQVSRRYGTDPSRSYLMGMSSGSFQTSATIAAYPELFAAAGVMAGGGYGMNWSCRYLPSDALVAAHAQLALAEMGPTARPIPFFAIGGTADGYGEQVPGGCSRMAFGQWMDTDDALLHAAGDAVERNPSAVARGQQKGGYAWTQLTYRTRHGCLVGQRVTVEGMGHFWSGGSNDPRWAVWTDPKGPSASLMSWRFFSHFRRGSACQEGAARTA